MTCSMHTWSYGKSKRISCQKFRKTAKSDKMSSTFSMYYVSSIYWTMIRCHGLRNDRGAEKSRFQFAKVQISLLQQYKIHVLLLHLYPYLATLDDKPMSGRHVAAANYAKTHALSYKTHVANELVRAGGNRSTLSLSLS